MHLLVVEDEAKTAYTLKQGLEEKGYTVQLAYNGEEALALASETDFDLVIMDVMMPKMNGFELSEKIRAQSSAPIIMLTALALTADKIKGFESGADDYLVKPFDFEELVARIKVSINRSRNGSGLKNELLYADLRLNLDTKEVYRGERMIVLTAKEYTLLEYMMRNKNRVLSKENITEQVWDLDFDTGTNIVEVYVSYLRNKIDKGFDRKLIHTKKGLGYIFREER